MNIKSIFGWLSFAMVVTAARLANAETNAPDPVGLFYISTNGVGETVKADNGSLIHLSGKSGIQILNARIYSENNANTAFDVYLNTSDFAVDPTTGAMTNEVALRIGERGYKSTGSGGKIGQYNSIYFRISNPNEAEIAAKALSTDCIARKPPGYKFLTQFIPTQEEFHIGQPVMVKFSIKNLDDRTMVFQNGGSQRGARNDQYGFRAMYFSQPVPDAGNGLNFGGPSVLVSLEPGKEFEDQVDLKKWFNFDKAGIYFIHGFYSLAFYPGTKIDSMAGWNLAWTDYASADFQIVVVK